MNKRGEPRPSRFMGMESQPSYLGETWLEPEELCYPSGGMHRRAKVRMPEGNLRIVVCGIPDTAFSIPTKGVIVKGIWRRGYITGEDTVDPNTFQTIETEFVFRYIKGD